MTTAVQHRRGTTAEHSTFTGLEGEVTIDTTKDTAVIHDGSLAGGYPLAKETLANVNPSTLSAITGAATASDDLFLMYDTSALAMKKISRAELNNAITVEALDTVDINGGTIDGTAIGGTTPAAGAFTSLSATSLTNTGNTTLGDASTDTVTVNGYMGVGVAPNSTIALYARGTALTGTTQTGVYSYPTGTSAATANVRAFNAQPATDAAAFTVSNVIGFLSSDPVKGAGSTITNAHGLYIADQTAGTNNYGITSAVSSGTNKWNIYASGTAANYFAGSVGIGTSSPSEILEVRKSVSATASPNYAVGLNLRNSNDGGNRILFGNSITTTLAAIDGTIESSGAGTNDGVLVFSTALNSSLTERARITSSGNLIQTVNTTAATLTTNQTLTFSIVDNSTLRISVRGSDGTTRTATIALS